MLAQDAFDVLFAGLGEVCQQHALVRGEVKFENGTPALRLDNMFAGSSYVAFQLALNTVMPFAYLMESGLEDLSVEGIQLDIESIDEERSVEIDRVWASKTRVRPGEKIELSAALKGANGAQLVKSVTYQIPSSLSPGDLHISFADSASVNLREWQSLGAAKKARDLRELVRAMNRLRPSDRLYVRVWRPGRAVRLESERLPAPPASVMSVLSVPTAAGSGSSEDWQSTLAELELDGLSSVVHGNVAMKVTVIE